jgi:hypothetical protein
MTNLARSWVTSFVKSGALACASLAVLAACDAPAPAAPEAAPAASVTPPPAAFDAAQAFAAVNPETLCVLFSRAVSDSTTKIKKSDCVVSNDAAAISLATRAGTDGLTVLLAEPGVTVQLSAANASPRAVGNAANGTFSSIGLVFIGKAPASSGLCMSVEYVAPDEASNSLFVSIDPMANPERFNLKISPEIAVSVYQAPVVPAGQIGAFALTRREERAEVKSVSFKSC